MILSKLLNATQVGFFSIYNYALSLEKNFGEFLKPHTPGIYIKGNIFPTIENGKNYFTKIKDSLGYESFMLVKDFDSVVTAVYDRDENELLTEQIMLHKKKYLTNTPELPVRAFILIFLIIQRHIEGYAQWQKHRHYDDTIARKFLPDFQDKFTEGHVEKFLSPLLDLIDEFIGEDTWHMYRVKWTYHDITIEKIIDYRIYCYYQRLEEDRLANKGDDDECGFCT